MNKVLIVYRIILTLAMIALFGWLTFNGYTYYKENNGNVTDRIYVGRIHFTAEQYSEFKDFIASHDVYMMRSKVILNSPDPLIDFSMKIYGDVKSEFGTLKNTHYVEWSDFWRVEILSFIFLAIVYIFLSGYIAWIARKC